MENKTPTANDLVSSSIEPVGQVQLTKCSLITYLDPNEIIKHIAMFDIKEYAYITHDSDFDENGILKKQHTHLYLRFNKKVDIKRVAHSFGIAVNLIEKVYCRDELLKYYIHKGYDDKFQYDIKLLHTNIKFIESILNDINPDDEAFYYFMELLDNQKFNWKYIIFKMYGKGYGKYVQKSSYLLKSLYDNRDEA